MFHTDTDSEVIAHLVEEHYAGRSGRGRAHGLQRAATGTSPSRSSTATIPTRSSAARRQCPLVVGVGDGETFMASAISAFLRETRRVQYVLDDEIVVATPDGAHVPDRRRRRDRARRSRQVDWDDDAAEKQGYETFMLKEIARAAGRDRRDDRRAALPRPAPAGRAEPLRRADPRG